jgi:flagellar assembly factor FliW
MIIQSKHFGRLEFAEERIITFPRGLIAFEQMKRYIIIENSEKENPFWWLQSVDNPDLVFVIISPFIFKPDYGFDLPPEEVEELGLESPQDAVVFSIVVVPKEIKKTTANLLAPLVINAKAKKGKQLILQDKDKNYTTKHLIFGKRQQQGQAKSGKGCNDARTD